MGITFGPGITTGSGITINIPPALPSLFMAPGSISDLESEISEYFYDGMIVDNDDAESGVVMSLTDGQLSYLSQFSIPEGSVWTATWTNGLNGPDGATAFTTPISLYLNYFPGHLVIFLLDPADPTYSTKLTYGTFGLPATFKQLP